jgi:microcystin-dependent protein
MSDPYLGEIRMFTGNYAPVGWATYTGQLLPISQNSALFSVIGTTFGGNGVTIFALPNLMDSVPMHWGNGRGLPPREWGEIGGEEDVTLTTDTVPSHGHAMQASGFDGDLKMPDPKRSLAVATGANAYQSNASQALQPFSLTSMGIAGGGLPHNNMQPFLTLTFIISLKGVFPQRPF